MRVWVRACVGCVCACVRACVVPSTLDKSPSANSKPVAPAVVTSTTELSRLTVNDTSLVIP